MNWLNLPTELWFRILSFVSQCNKYEQQRRKLCLVCHRFNSIMLNVEKCKFIWCTTVVPEEDIVIVASQACSTPRCARTTLISQVML